MTEKRANIVYPKTFDVFVNDWLKSLINIHDKIVTLAANQADRVAVKLCRMYEKVLGFKMQLKTPGRRTAKEKVAPQLQLKVSTALKISYIRSVKEYKILLGEVNTCVELVFVLQRVLSFYYFVHRAMSEEVGLQKIPSWLTSSMLHIL